MRLDQPKTLVTASVTPRAVDSMLCLPRPFPKYSIVSAEGAL